MHARLRVGRRAVTILQRFQFVNNQGRSAHRNLSNFAEVMPRKYIGDTDVQAFRNRVDSTNLCLRNEHGLPVRGGLGRAVSVDASDTVADRVAVALLCRRRRTLHRDGLAAGSGSVDDGRLQPLFGLLSNGRNQRRNDY